MQNKNKNQTPLRILGFSVLLFIGFSLTTCDNTLDPLKDGASYSVYGALELFRTNTFIRVKDLQVPVSADTTRDIDATVTLENLDRGISEVLQDRVVRFDSVATHNFVADMQIEPATEYELTIEGSGGIVSTRATTPHHANVNISRTGRECDDQVTVTFNPVNREASIVMSFRFISFGGRAIFEANRVIRPPETGPYNGELSSSFIPGEIFREPPQGGLSCENTFRIALIYSHYGPGSPPVSPANPVNISNELVGRFVGFFRGSDSIPLDN